MVVGLLMVTSLQAQNLRQTNFWAAVVREDGLVVPLAYFDNSLWAPLSSSTSFDQAHSFPTQWFFWPVKGHSRVINTGIPIQFEKWQGERAIGFTSDYCPRIMEASGHPYPKAGIAFESAVPFNPFLPLDTSDQVTRQLIATLTKELTLRESERLADPNIATRYPGPVPSQQVRQRTRPRIESLHRTTNYSDSGYIYHFELVKSYRFKDCSTFSQFSGWATGFPSTLTYVGATFSIGDCDGKGLPNSIEPFGALHLNGTHLLWWTFPVRGNCLRYTS